MRPSLSLSAENLANVTNVDATRSEDGTTMTVTWTPLSLEEVGGFFEIEVVASVSNDRRRQQTDITKRVPYSESSAELTGLDPNDDYSVTARTVLTGSDGSTESGSTSQPLEVDSPGILYVIIFTKKLQINNYYYILGMGDYENMSQRLLFLQVSRLLRLLATLHMYVDFIQQSN